MSACETVITGFSASAGLGVLPVQVQAASNAKADNAAIAQHVRGDTKVGKRAMEITLLRIIIECMICIIL